MSVTPEDPKVYGWCPGALRPMMSGDGLVLRIRAPLGRLTQDQARGIAQLSQRYGNGLLDLSARGNLQLRGLAAADHPALIAALRDLDLVDRTAAEEARRNILLTPFWTPGDASLQIAEALGRALTRAADLTLPGKFGFAVDAGPTSVLQETAADIRIERTVEADTGASFLLRADGAETGRAVSLDQAADEAIALARWFLAEGGAREGRGRMHRLVARRGPPPAHGAPRPKGAEAPTPGQCENGQLVALEFGQMPATTLAALADIAPCRLTPWRMLQLETIQTIAPLPGLILDATDPRLHVTACTGRPGCLQAHAPTRALARHLATGLQKGQRLHVSGCSKGCAHPAPCDRTLVATSPTTFDLIAHGKASDPPLQQALSADALSAAPELLNKGQP